MSEPSENVQSQLSAFVDNELSQDETELLARRVSRDSDMQQRMSRYMLIGEALRAPSSAQISRDFSQRVADAIAQQNQSTEQQTAKVIGLPTSRWLKPAVGLSLAASVAALALVTVQSLQTASDTSSTNQLATNNVAPAGNSDVVPYATTAPSVPISATRLTNYVVAHSEFTSPLGHRNTMTGLVTGDQQTTATDVTDDSADEVVDKQEPKK
jgi:sigma-E factor negative regulatory protein RseA